MAKHLQKEERIKLESLYDNDTSVFKIAKYLKRHRSTIYRELNRYGICKSKYEAESFHNQARNNMSRIQDATQPAEEIITLIERKILNEQWSPEQISEWMKKHDIAKVSHTWIYKYISKDKASGGELYNHMRRGGSYTKGHSEYRGNIKDRVSIEERPKEANERTRLGDYEIDLIVGPKNKGAILTAVDRLSRECRIKKLDGKSSESVAAAIIQLLNKVITVTSDNGTEFSKHIKIAKELDIQYFFAHPYASYERGSIENLNGLIRQYIPKKTTFEDLLDSDLQIIQDKLNHRPRKVLDFLSPIEYVRKIEKDSICRT